MGKIIIHQDAVHDPVALTALCPFQAIEWNKNRLEINAGCRMCKLCVKNGNGVFEFVEESPREKIDLSQWQGIAVVAEICGKSVHPVTWELLGKARELAGKVHCPVFCLMMGYSIKELSQQALEYGADEVFVYDDVMLEHFRIEPCAAVMEDFIASVKPSVLLVGGTECGRSLAPRLAARFRTGLTADCTFLDITESGQLDQIRPAYGGNIMAHIYTPHHRPQFATVRYKIFPLPPRQTPHGKITLRSLPENAGKSAITIRNICTREQSSGIEDAEVIVAGGRGFRKKEDLALLEELAGLLNGKVASTRALVEANWTGQKQQIGLSGRTVKPKLLIACGISGAVQFTAGMSGAERIIAINTDENAPIFKVSHVGIVGDLYEILPDLIEKVKQQKANLGQ